MIENRPGHRAWGCPGTRVGYAAAISPDEACLLALALPGAVQADHHGRPSFRVEGKIFATLWEEARLNVMLE
jgi:hypothetical protein